MATNTERRIAIALRHALTILPLHIEGAYGDVEPVPGGSVQGYIDGARFTLELAREDGGFDHYFVHIYSADGSMK